MKNKLIYIFLTGFYSGKSKYMPGTFGTLVGVLIFQLISFNTLYENIFLLLVLFLSSILLLNYSYEKSIFLDKDDKSIVIDEILGYLIFMIFFENNIKNVIFGFILFRFFDIVKPFPISLVDKKIKNSFGVMFDDIIAALFSGIILFMISYVF
tara:strand:- start:223 stop:681 length:459 start_codon:yes stop_codon:yes gene_type:complete